MGQSDPDVRSAVEALLAHDQTGQVVLDRPAWEMADELLASGMLASSMLASDESLVREDRFSPGEQLGPYRVESKIGSGGVGEVYRAEDVRLGRSVAIKVSAEQFSKGFEREAKAIAALNHPNICQIYDIGPDYLVMEYVDGVPVASELAHSPAEALVLAKQIAAALQAAHDKGVTHRDLKPANILVTSEGAVKLLDFGLAKRDGARGASNATQTFTAVQPGMIVGTPAYMSPEQAEGKPADPRSDIFSFGAVFYEMLSGVRAFREASLASTLGAVLHKTPHPLTVPPALNAIVFQCLAKSPDERFQNAGDLLAALERASTRKAGVSSWRRSSLAVAIAGGLLTIAALAWIVYPRLSWHRPISSIAVLPLDIRSSDSDADYISDGISESVNNSLARLPGIKVIPHSVAVHYKGKSADFRKAGEALGVETVLTGRVVQRGNDLTIGVELDDVRNERQLWGQQYHRKLSDLLAVQNDIAREVSQRLRSQLSEADQQREELGSTANPQAYQLYLKGKYFTDKFTKEGFAKGIAYLEQAIALDPHYALAHSELAYNYVNQDDWFINPRAAGPKARDEARKALAIDESDVGAHVVLAIEAQWYEWDWATSEREFKRAIELDPNSSAAHAYYSWLLAPMGRNEEALAEAELARKIDPLGTLENFGPGSILVFLHEWDKAIQQMHVAIDLDPNYWFDHCFLGRAYEQKGKLPEAISEFQRALALDGSQTESLSGLGHAFAPSGKQAGSGEGAEPSYGTLAS